jgi:hypothetical protein
MGRPRAGVGNQDAQVTVKLISIKKTTSLIKEMRFARFESPLSEGGYVHTFQNVRKKVDQK